MKTLLLMLVPSLLLGQIRQRSAPGPVAKVIICQDQQRTIAVGDTLAFKAVLFNPKTHDRLPSLLYAVWGVTDTSVASTRSGVLYAKRPGQVTVFWRLQQAPRFISTPFVVTVVSRGSPITQAPMAISPRRRQTGCGYTGISETV